MQEVTSQDLTGSQDREFRSPVSQEIHRWLSPPPRLLVTGPRGSPGITEVSIVISCLLSRSRPFMLCESDLAGVGLGLRLGLPPSMHHSLRLEWIGQLGVLYRTPHPLHHIGAANEYDISSSDNGSTPTQQPPEVMSPAHRHTSSELPAVVDVGPGVISEGDDRVVFVVEPTPVGLIRAAELLSLWSGAPPWLVVNRVRHPNQLPSVRAALGLEPIASIPVVATPGIGEPPSERMMTALGTAARRIRGSLLNGQLGSFPKSVYRSASPEREQR